MADLQSRRSSDDDKTVSVDYVHAFARRAKYYLISAVAIGAAIFTLLALSAYIFFYAEDIGGRAGNIDLLREVQRERLDLEETASQLMVEVAGVAQEQKVGQRTVYDVLNAEKRSAETQTLALVLKEKERLMLEEKYFSDAKAIETKEELHAQAEGLDAYVQRLEQLVKTETDRFSVGEITKTDLAQAKRFLAEAKSESNLVKSREARAPGVAELSKRSRDLDLINLIGTNLVRFGGLAVAMFLVSLLVPIYRYNMRLAGFYLARADAIKICKELGIDEFIKVSAVLTPSYEFEQGPPTPAEMLAGLVKEGIGVLKR